VTFFIVRSYVFIEPSGLSAERVTPTGGSSIVGVSFYLWLYLLRN
jgi:hypothetical protein